MPSKRVTQTQRSAEREENLPRATKGPRKGATARKTPIGHATRPEPPKRGPRGWQPNAAGRREVENLVILGIDDVAIARYFGIHVDTLRKHCQIELDNAVMTAGREAIGNLRKLGAKQDRPNYYMLGNRFTERWRDTRHVEMNVDVRRPDLSHATDEQLQVLRQAALVMQQLKAPPRTIEHDSTATGPAEPDEDSSDD